MRILEACEFGVLVTGITRAILLSKSEFEWKNLPIAMFAFEFKTGAHQTPRHFTQWQPYQAPIQQATGASNPLSLLLYRLRVTDSIAVRSLLLLILPGHKDHSSPFQLRSIHHYVHHSNLLSDPFQCAQNISLHCRTICRLLYKKI